MGFTIGVFLGFSVGSIGTLLLITFVLRKKSVGTLRIDQSDPYDGPCLFLEIKGPSSYNQILDSKYVTMTVSKKNYVTQK